jgi:hypothetical protein
MNRRIVLESPLAPAAIALKLRETIGDRARQARVGMAGQGSDSDMLLRVYRADSEEQGLNIRLKATMERSGRGTRITGRIGTPRVADLLMVFWFGFLIVFLATVLTAPATRHVTRTNWPLVAIPVGMIVFGIILHFGSARTAKKDVATILTFLRDTVSAHEISGE